MQAGPLSPEGGKTMLQEVTTTTMSLIKDYLTHRQGQQLSRSPHQRTARGPRTAA